MLGENIAKALDGMRSLGEFLLYSKKIRVEVIQRGASYLSQGFEDNVLGSSPADWLIL